MTLRTAFLSLALLVPGLAQAIEVTGVVQEDELVVRILRADGSHVRLAAELAVQLRPFAGHPVRLSGELRGGRLREGRILSPVRDDREVVIDEVEAGWTLTEASGAQHRAFGNTDILQKGRKTQADLWIFEDGAACVVAVEAQTTGEWTFLRSRILGYEVPAGFVRGLNRSVWITGRRANGDLFVRRGDDAGWVRPDTLAMGEAVQPREGLTDRLR